MWESENPQGLFAISSTPLPNKSAFSNYFGNHRLFLLPPQIHFFLREEKCGHTRPFRGLHCPGPQLVDHTGTPKTPVHADTGQAPLEPLQSHLQVPAGPGRRAGGPAIPQTLPPADINSQYATPRILSFPRNLINPEETRKGLAAAFRMWSDVSPFRFREVAPEHPSDLQIGG